MCVRGGGARGDGCPQTPGRRYRPNACDPLLEDSTPTKVYFTPAHQEIAQERLRNVQSVRIFSDWRSFS